MHKKLVSVAIGIAMVATPLLASAQTADTSEASLIASLTALVQMLTQELQQLIAGQGGPTIPAQSTTPANSTNLTASPSSGTAPMTVNFSVTLFGAGRGAVSNSISYGDGSTGTLTTVCGGETNTGCRYTGSHTYQNPGTYTASAMTTLWCLTTDTNGNCTAQNPTKNLGSVPVIVTSQGNSSTLSATCHGNPYNSGTPGISWASTPSGGIGSYTYQWSLANDNTGTGISGTFADLQQQNLLATYGSIGTKNGTVVVNSGGQSTTANCSATIRGNSNATPVQTNPVVINSFTASPTTVTSGQSMTFSWSSNLSSTDISYYGGGCYITSPTNAYSELNAVGNSTNYGPSGSFTYTPTATATYTLYCYSGGKDGSPQATQQVPVNVGSSSIQPAATIDLNSLTAKSGYPVISGSATGVSSVYVYVSSANDAGGVLVPVINGSWNSGVIYAKAETNGFPAGTYTVTVSSGYSGPMLTSGTLTIQSAALQAQVQNLLNQMNQQHALFVSSPAQPANSLAPQGATVPFTTFSLTNNSAVMSNVNGLTFQNVGGGTDTALAKLYLMDSNGSIVTGPAIINPLTHSASFTDLIQINPGTTRTFTLYGNVASNIGASNGGVISLALISVNTSGTVMGSLPISGASQTLNGSLNVCYPPQTSVYGYQCW